MPTDLFLTFLVGGLDERVRLLTTRRLHLDISLLHLDSPPVFVADLVYDDKINGLLMRF